MKASTLDCLGEADGTQVLLAENSMLKYDDIAYSALWVSSDWPRSTAKMLLDISDGDFVRIIQNDDVTSPTYLLSLGKFWWLFWKSQWSISAQNNPKGLVVYLPPLNGLNVPLDVCRATFDNLHNFISEMQHFEEITAVDRLLQEFHTIRGRHSGYSEDRCMGWRMSLHGLVCLMAARG